MSDRKIIVTITEVATRHEYFDVSNIVPDDVKDEDVGEWLMDHGHDYQIDEDTEWETIGFNEDSLEGVDTDRYDVYKDDKQLTGGHL